MGFASAYLEKRTLFPIKIQEAPDRGTGIIVVVPAYSEPGINKLLESLARCHEPDCKVEVIIVINAPENATEADLAYNTQTIINIESWKKENKDCFFRLFVLDIGQVSGCGWGVGMARKTGMDEAAHRFNSIEKPGGVILNLDADCTVATNYFLTVYNELLKKSDRSACSICFEHPLSGAEFPEDIYKNITLYELHLRFYYQGLAFTGFPYVFHTVGSAIAVKALAYVKAGGMNRRQAGEDFYFIQKLVPAGGYFNLNSTIVFPSPRTSFRVPFGTGASVRKLICDDNSTLLTYNMLAFKELRTFFKLTDLIYRSDVSELQKHYMLVPHGLRLFLDEKEWMYKMMEVKNNTSGMLSFRKRFYAWFNMFQVVKYLNSVHRELFPKKPVDISAAELLEAKGILIDSKEPSDLLKYYRKMERP